VVIVVDKVIKATTLIMLKRTKGGHEGRRIDEIVFQRLKVILFTVTFYVIDWVLNTAFGISLTGLL
jgi:hypothetical protein